MKKIFQRILNAKMSGKSKKEIQNLQQETDNPTFRPLREGLRIRESNINGQGLFATRDWKVGEVIGITHLQDERFQDGWCRTATGGFINHSDTPNIKIVNDNDMKYGKVVRHIFDSEEMTSFYHLYSL
tara:strand:+ start:1281 stop:1664 length:384 start_codon:yes stop_codon:yes gene_type:complete